MAYLKKSVILAVGSQGPEAVRKLCQPYSDAILRARIAQIAKLLDKPSRRQAGARSSARDVQQFLAVELARRIELTPPMARILIRALDGRIEILEYPPMTEVCLIKLGLLRWCKGTGLRGGALVANTLVGIEAAKLYRTRQIGDLDLTGPQAKLLAQVAQDTFWPQGPVQFRLTRALVDRGLLQQTALGYRKTPAGHVAFRLYIALHPRWKPG